MPSLSTKKINSLWLISFWLIFSMCTWLLLKETPPGSQPFPHFDKLLHAIGFVGLTFFALKAYPATSSWILACMAIYGASTEVLQGALTITREASVLDWVADMVGASLARFTLLGIYKK